MSYVVFISDRYYPDVPGDFCGVYDRLEDIPHAGLDWHQTHHVLDTETQRWCSRGGTDTPGTLPPPSPHDFEGT